MPSQLFRRLFVANRGEVASRIGRTCDSLGIVPIFGVSTADIAAPWVVDRERVVLGPAHPAKSYLDVERVVQAAVQARASALHPGWGFLAEDPLLASLCEAHGIRFIGPPAHVMAKLGDKLEARRAMAKVGLDILPGSEGPVADPFAATEIAQSIGYPVLLKAVSGGGGRGMRIARSTSELRSAFEEAAAEAKAAFGDGRVYIERLVEGARHIEVQVLADRYGGVVHLGERDCTVQRNHQKLIEESPCPVIGDETRARILETAVAAVAAVGYVGAGTLELLLDPSGRTFFIEMNARLQVEHPVSEVRSGIDLVAEQLFVAAGAPLRHAQDRIELRGHAIECRLNAEDPSDAFRPSPGKITRWSLPPIEGLRIDTFIDGETEIPPYYDSLICKMIAHASTRDGAIDRMLDGLAQWVCEGVQTTAPMHRAILESEAFRSHRYDTTSLPGWPPRAEPRES